MKTMILNCSPKKSFSASSYFAGILGAFTGGEIIREKLRSKGDFSEVLDSMKSVDSVVFCMPMYVDTLPSHLLSFLKKMEESGVRPCIYVISNGGFIEGKQSQVVMRIFENFCRKSGCTWKGGVGIGGGVMLNVTRILLPVFVGLLAVSILISGISYGNWVAGEAWRSFLIQLLVLLFLNSGVLFETAKMAVKIRKQADFGEHYTRIMLPSFLFILIADIYFAVVSVFKGGIFRGWLRKHGVKT
ncbi:MAG: hypothetical protein LUH23_09075 [Oscillospiraceae bacterium]|nr:hypothetical protein [Oscillospiraceae bacterium]